MAGVFKNTVEGVCILSDEKMVVCSECASDIMKSEIGGYDNAGKPMCIDCAEEMRMGDMEDDPLWEE